MRNAFILIVLGVAACAKAPVFTDGTDNKEIPIDRLFTHEGCSIYRFHDFGDYHYFSDCRNAVTNRCGKGCEDSISMPLIIQRPAQ